MANRIRVEVNADVLKWARESRALSIEVAARKLGTSPERLLKWESGEERPTPNQLRKIAKQYVRPICVFFLPAPPIDEEPGLKDFRRLHEAEVAVEFSPELKVEIRLAHERRSEAIDLAIEAGVDLTTEIPAASLKDDPESFAKGLRNALRLSQEDQSRWRNQYEAFAEWRSKIENLGILVFQTGRSPQQFIDTKEARGFSISEEVLPVIVVNGKDAVPARCFTLLHELTHLALRSSGVCDPFDRTNREQSRFAQVEIFCNHVAGATLVPEDALFATPEVRNHEGGIEWTDNELSALARKFWVSWEVCLRRLVILGLTTNRFYSDWRRNNDDRYPGRESRGDVKLPMYTRVIRRNGRLYPRIVLDALREGCITYSRAAGYLGAGANHLPKIEVAVFDPRYVG